MKESEMTIKNNEGQAIIIAVILFLFISLTIVISIASPIIKQIKIAQDFQDSRQTFFLVESGVEDVTYRVFNSLTVGSLESLTIDGNTTQTSVTDTPSGKDVSAEGDVRGAVRKVASSLVSGAGVAFNYGVQVGYGGLEMENNAGVYGSVYSNGPIIGENDTFVTGSAYSADGAASSVDQANDTPSTPTDSIEFARSNSNEDLAQSFQVTSDDPVSRVQFYLKKVGNPSNRTVRIVDDNNGQPSEDEITKGTLSASSVTSSYSWVEATFEDIIQLTPSTTYWLVIDGNDKSSKYYIIGANNTYGNGTAMVGRYSNEDWNDTSPADLDAYFKLYLGGTTGHISYIDIGENGVGNGYASTIDNTDAEDTLYCQTGANNNQSCNTSQTPPSPLAFPISEGNINDWKSEAEAGGTINGDYDPDDGSYSLGPTKITGDMDLENNVTLSITGTVFVEGNIDIGNNIDISCAESYGDDTCVLLTDGWIHVDNNAVFDGTSDPASFMLVLTTNDCNGSGSPTNSECTHHDGAVDLHNNVDGSIFYSSAGMINFHNNVDMEQITAYKLRLENNATITYDIGLADIEFTSGPSGAWSINNWEETI